MLNKDKKNKYLKKIVLACALAVFVFQLAVPAILLPQKAQAVLGIGDVSVTIGDIPRNIWETISRAVKKAADVAYKNVLKNYLNSLAYNAATGIATGEWGQKPLFPTHPEEILTQAADVAAGDFLDKVASDWIGKSQCYGYTGQQCKTDAGCPPPVLYCPESVDKNKLNKCGENAAEMNNCLALGCRVENLKDRQDFKDVMEASNNGEYPLGGYYVVPGIAQCTSGFSLCETTDPLKLKISVMARSGFEKAPSPEITGKCPLTDIIDNFESGKIIGYDSSNRYLLEISKSFNPEASQFGMLMTIQDKTQEKSTLGQENKKFAQSLTGGFNSVTSKISKTVETPAPLIEGTIKELTGKSVDLSQTYTGTLIADVVGTFTSTLASKLMQRYFSGLVKESPSTGGSRLLFGGLFSGSRGGITAAKIQFASLKKVDYSTGGEIDILSKLSSCPDKKDPTPDTCVIDDRFRTAIQQELTVRQALDQGLLDGNKVFGFDVNGREPEYFNGYPYRSLVILRKYRVIPVGWELAAKYIKKYSQGNYTLDNLVNEYDNPTSPFYRLVDPNWVLKSPEVYCRKQGAGEKVLFTQAVRGEDTNNDGVPDLSDAASNIVQRQNDYCADEQMCLRENDDGSCQKFGYCTEEKELWRFKGDSCDSYNTSCLSFLDAQGAQVSYLTNTVDYNNCSVDNAGCRWYCQDRDLVNNTWTCSNLAPDEGGNMLTLNSKAEECSSSDEGCHQFIRIKDNGANLLRNSGFEDFITEARNYNATDGARDSGLVAAGNLPDDFVIWNDTFSAGVGYRVGLGGNPQGLRAFAYSDVYEGLTAARLHNYGGSNDNAIIQVVDTGALTDNRTFTFSFYAKLAPDTVGNCAAPANEVNFYISRYPGGAEQKGTEAKIGVSENWTRYVVETTWPAVNPTVWANESEKKMIQAVIEHTDNNCDIIVDNAQLEEGRLTDYKNYNNNPKTYLAKAPDYYNCYDGDPANDDQACQNFAQSCLADQVGCEAYTSAATGNVIDGLVTNPNLCDPNNPASCDQCPAEFVGCQAFREMPIEHSPRRPARDPVSFVASTGQSCTAAAVGCEEYTNLEKEAAGGESKEYYSQIRQCVPTSDADLKSFYTWEGSEEFGYQLVDYKLKESDFPVDENGDGAVDPAGAPCTNMVAENSAYGANNWPACADGDVFDEDFDGIPDNHDVDVCVDFGDVCVAGTCSIYGTSCTTNADCIDNQLEANPDCTRFFDAEGNVYYRLKSRVIYGSDSCQQYRNTIDGSSFIHHLIPGQGAMCQASEAGCREYKGNAGDNIRLIYNNNFEDGTLGLWSAPAGSSAVYANESLNFGGHSMLVANQGMIDDVFSGKVDFQPDRSYKLSFWAKAANSETKVIAEFLPIGQIFPGTAIVSADEWKYYELGPLYLDDSFFNAGPVQFVLGSNDAPVFIDNIKITEIYDSIYRIKDSYTECSGYENCDKYSDRSGTTHYLKSFSSLCPSDKVGCEAVVDTENTSSPYALVKQQTSANTLKDLLGNNLARGDVDGDGMVILADAGKIYEYTGNRADSSILSLEAADANNDGIVDERDAELVLNYVVFGGPAPSQAEVYSGMKAADDSTMFLVVDDSHACVSTSKGCERVGQPAFDSEESVESYQDAFIINDPENYNQTACMYEENMCQEYTADGGSKYYFKDPGNRVCEYKRVTGQPAGGWYKQGTESGPPDCPSNWGVCNGGTNDGATCAGNNDCTGGGMCLQNKNLPVQPTDGWVGLCPESESGCTKFIDPQAITTANSQVIGPELTTNGSFEALPLDRANAAWGTDGLLDSGFVPDTMQGWQNRQMSGGIPCGLRTAVITQASGIVPTDGDNATIIKTYDACPGGDPALYIWHLMKASGNTNNKSFKLSFDFKKAEPAMDADCSNAGADVDLFFQMERTIDDRRPGGWGDYLSGYWETATSNWQSVEKIFTFSSTPVEDSSGNLRDWVATTKPLEQLQKEFNLIFRRRAENGGHRVCDLVIDNIKVEEVSSSAGDESYYYISDTVDRSSCNGIISSEEGCRLFQDMSGGEAIYSSAASKNGQPPVLCADTPDPNDCDSNAVLSVKKDRECAKWLECETTLSPEQGGDSNNQSCLSRYLCDEMDPDTGACISIASANNSNNTFSSPAFATELENMSGLVLTGIDWEKRCDNDPNIICLYDKECSGGGRCGDPQIIRGYRPYDQMEQIGSASSYGDLVSNGDMGDSDYQTNQKLSCRLSGGDEGCVDINSPAENPPDSLVDTDPDFISGWRSRPNGRQDENWDFVNDSLETANVYWTEEDQNNGSVPSKNSNLDENNILWIKTNGIFTGAQYQLPVNSIVSGRDYMVSLRMKWGATPGEYDKVLVELSYADDENDRHGLAAWVSEPFPITSQWQDYVLGPVTGGQRRTGSQPPKPVDRDYVNLNIIHYYDNPDYVYSGTCSGGGRNGGTCYLDQHCPGGTCSGVCKGGANAGNSCLAVADCPGGSCVKPYQAPSTDIYVDDVSLKPALSAQYGVCQGGVDDGKACRGLDDCAYPGICVNETNLSRSCRLYPSDDAPYCSYTDQNSVIHQGWYGYCIEHDPDYPKYCLNWWPVDLIKGEQDLFGSLQEAGYTGRQPLYMCLESEGNYDSSHLFRAIGSSPSQVSNSDDWGGDNCSTTDEISPILDKEYGYRRPFETRFIGNRNGGSSCEKAGDMRNMADCRNGNYDGMCGYCDASDGDGCDVINTPGIGTRTWNITNLNDRKYRWDIDKIVILAQRWSHDDWRPESDQAIYADGSPAQSGVVPDGRAYMVLDDNSSGRAWCSTDCWCASWREKKNVLKKNVLTVSVCFDNQSQLNTVGIYAWDGNNGGGFAALPVMYLKEPCTKVAQVVENSDNKVWLDRTQQTSNYIVPDLSYQYEQHFAPFGGIVQPDPITSIPDAWTAVSGKGPLMAEIRERDASTYAHSGSPYSFGTPPSDSGGRMCTALVSGSDYPTQNECRNKADIEKCFAGPDGDPETLEDNGYCIGTGQGFCRLDPTKVCTTSTQESDCTGADLKYYGPCIMGGAGAAGINNYNVAKDKIERLFAKIYGVWSWDEITGQYSEDAIVQALVDADYRNMPPCPSNSRPTIASAEYCGASPIVTARTSSGSKVTLGASGGTVQFNFNIQADKEQLPINTIAVDWGDGSPETEFFGHFADGNISIDHTYAKVGVFRPKMKVVDNWDWCGVAPGVDCNDAGYECRDLNGCSFPASVFNDRAGEGYVDLGIVVQVGS